MASIIIIGIFRFVSKFKRVKLTWQFFCPSWHFLSLSIRRGRFSRVNWAASSDRCVCSIMRMNGHVRWFAKVNVPENKDLIPCNNFRLQTWQTDLSAALQLQLRWDKLTSHVLTAAYVSSIRIKDFQHSCIFPNRHYTKVYGEGRTSLPSVVKKSCSL